MVIPARYGSTRLPAKPLAMIAGMPMIERVYRCAAGARGVEGVIVATDDGRIAEVVRKAGGEAVLTSPRHASGTDRIAEVAEKLPADVIVNVQGDLPHFPAEMIRQAVSPLEEDPRPVIGTLARPIERPEEYYSPNAVKVVTDSEGFALYFSRSPIPHIRDAKDPSGVFGPAGIARKHFGIYAYRREFLLKFPSLPPGQLERLERLEQLRVLEQGFKIKVAETRHEPIEVDTEEDLERVRRIIEESERSGHD